SMGPPLVGTMKTAGDNSVVYGRVLNAAPLPTAWLTWYVTHGLSRRAANRYVLTSVVSGSAHVVGGLHISIAGSPIRHEGRPDSTIARGTCVHLTRLWMDQRGDAQCSTEA